MFRIRYNAKVILTYGNKFSPGIKFVVLEIATQLVSIKIRVVMHFENFLFRVGYFSFKFSCKNYLPLIFLPFLLKCLK